MELIMNGNIMTMENEQYENGYLVMEHGKIQSLGNMDDLQMERAQFEHVFDAGGMMVLPGFVDAHSHIGMWEDGLGFEGADGNEDTDPITPHLRAIDAINPMDTSFGEGLAAGVTTSVTGPGSANVLGGSFAAIKMWGNRIDDMIIQSPVAIKAALGENPKHIYHAKNQSPVTRMATAAILREALCKAKDYLNAMEKYENNPEEEDKPEIDIKSDALIAVLQNRLPLKVHAHRADDIFTAIRIAKEFGISITLEHATEAYMVAKEIAKEGYPVLIGPMLCERSKPELKNLSFASGGLLEKAGIHPAIVTDHPVIPVQYLPICAALCVREGMSTTCALEAITINAARCCGIDARVGSLAPGKDADIVIFKRHPFELMATPERVYINGVARVIKE